MGTVQVDTTGAVSLGEPMLDEAVRGSLMLDARRFPESRFDLVALSAEDREPTYGRLTPASLHGRLILKGRTQPLRAPAEIEPVIGARNSRRFPTYIRFDFKARRVFDVRRGSLTLTVDIVNLTDRDNACCVDDFFFDPLPDGTVAVEEELDNWLGITPSASLL